MTTGILPVVTTPRYLGAGDHSVEWFGKQVERFIYAVTPQRVAEMVLRTLRTQGVAVFILIAIGVACVIAARAYRNSNESIPLLVPNNSITTSLSFDKEHRLPLGSQLLDAVCVELQKLEQTVPGFTPQEIAYEGLRKNIIDWEYTNIQDKDLCTYIDETLPQLVKKMEADAEDAESNLHFLEQEAKTPINDDTEKQELEETVANLQPSSSNRHRTYIEFMEQEKALISRAEIYVLSRLYSGISFKIQGAGDKIKDCSFNQEAKHSITLIYQSETGRFISCSETVKNN